MFGPGLPEVIVIVALLAIPFSIWLVLALFLVSAKTAGIEDGTYGKAFLAVILRTFISIVITLVFSLLPIIGTIIGIILAFLVNGGITAGIFSVSYGKGLLTEIIFMFIGFCLMVGVVVVGFLAMGGAAWTAFDNFSFDNLPSIERFEFEDKGSSPYARHVEVDRSSARMTDFDKKDANRTPVEVGSTRTAPTSAKGVTLFEDNFESYSLNKWPSAGWTGYAGNDSDHSVNRIETDPTDPNNQVFRLTASGSNWSAGALGDVVFTDHYKVDFRVYNGNEVVSDYGQQHRASIGMKNGHHWSNHGRGLLGFNKNGNVSIADNILQSYETRKWYDVSIEYNRVSDTRVELRYWVDDVYRGRHSFPVDDLSEELSLNHIQLGVQRGAVYYDDVRITSIP